MSDDMTAVHVRHAWAGELELRGDDPAGRTVYGRLFPFDEWAEIYEPDDAGTMQHYEESFLPDCTLALRQRVERRMAGVPAFLKLKLGHDDDLEREIGAGMSLTERSDGAYAAFRLYDGPHLPKVRSMLSEAYKGLSVEFSDIRPPIVAAAGALPRVQRRQINIFAVAAVPAPAYVSAGILAMRSADDAAGGDTPNLDRARVILDELRAASAR